MTFAVISDRVAGQVLLSEETANINGDQDINSGLPPGFGDCLLIELSITILGIATIETTFESSGPCVQIVDPAGNPADIHVCARWQRRSATAVTAHLIPDQLIFWRGAEQIHTSFPEIDTNVTPTADLGIFAKVRRLRQSVRRDADHSDRLGRIVLTS